MLQVVVTVHTVTVVAELAVSETVAISTTTHETILLAVITNSGSNSVIHQTCL